MKKGDLDYYYQGNFRPCPGIWDILERLLLLVHDDELAHNLNINKLSNRAMKYNDVFLTVSSSTKLSGDYLDRLFSVNMDCPTIDFSFQSSSLLPIRQGHKSFQQGIYFSSD